MSSNVHPESSPSGIKDLPVDSNPATSALATETSCDPGNRNVMRVLVSDDTNPVHERPSFKVT